MLTRTALLAPHSSLFFSYVFPGVERRCIAHGTEQNMIAIEGHRKHRSAVSFFLSSISNFDLFKLIELLSSGLERKLLSPFYKLIATIFIDRMAFSFDARIDSINLWIWFEMGARLATHSVPLLNYISK